MLPKEILAQIKHIQLKAGYLVTDALAGEFSSAFKGSGVELDKVREYTEGDDVRAIDWNVTARMNYPFIKIYKEERELTLMLMIDVSSSLNFGTTGKFKNEVAAELAAVLAFLATKNNDKVGLIIFSDHVEHYIPPKKGRSHIWMIIRTILTHKSKGTKTHLKSACDFMVQICKKKSACFLLSDFICETRSKALSQIARRHNLVCVGINDQREQKMVPCGYTSFVDLETGRTMMVDTYSKKFREIFAQKRINEKESLLKEFKRNKIDYFEVNTKDSLVTPLIRYIRKRERQKR